MSGPHLPTGHNRKKKGDMKNAPLKKNIQKASLKCETEIFIQPWNVI